MKNILKDETGSVLVIVVLSIVVLIGFTALAVDGGHMFFRHEKLQDVADAASLGAANELVSAAGNNNKKKESAFNEAVDIVTMNGIAVSNKSGYSADITMGNGEAGQLLVSFPGTDLKKVKVDLNIDASLSFARVLSIDTANIAASATAFAGYIGEKTGGLIPLGIVDKGNSPDLTDDYVPYMPVPLTLGPSQGEGGNYGWLNFTTTSELVNWLLNGYDSTITVGEVIETAEGVKVGNAGDAMLERIGGCTVTGLSDSQFSTDLGTVNTYTNGTATDILAKMSTTPELVEIQTRVKTAIDAHLGEEHTNELGQKIACPRLVYTPIVDSIDSEGEVLGFAAYFIQNYIHTKDAHDPDNENLDKLTLTGYFINVVDPSVITPSSSGTVFAIRLIE